MKGFTHRWKLTPGNSAEREARVFQAGDVEPLVARVLFARGYCDDAAIAAFRDARMIGMHDPSLLPGMDRAAERILGAARAGERLVIYGDYDVDGITASAILFHTIRALVPSADVHTYVPHRLDEGYGLHADAITKLAEDGARVIVSVDCGITAFDAARAARGVGGTDLIITDHHTPASDGTAPDAFAIIHPRLAGFAYPFGDLCGAGVAFKLAWRLATLAENTKKVSEPLRLVLLDCLALAALGTIADIVPLIGENRIIARHGLRRLRSTSLIGLRALIEASDLAGESIDSEKVGFILGPRLNACGRMGHAKDAVELFTTANAERARVLAQGLTKLNDDRRATERRIFDQACAQADAAGMTGDDRRAIVLAHEDWHAGVVGIVCSRLIGKFHRPTILLQRSNGQCHGSGRSIDGFNLHEALGVCAGHLTKFGGHDMAAGLTLESASLDAFAESFIRHASSLVAVDDLTPSLRIDCAAKIDELTPRAAEQLEELGPFGRGNGAPALLLEDVQITRPPEPMGARGVHIAFFVRQGGRELRIVAWNWSERRDMLRAGMGLDVVIEPKVNRWNGNVRVEAQLRDARVRGD